MSEPQTALLATRNAATDMVSSDDKRSFEEIILGVSASAVPKKKTLKYHQNQKYNYGSSSLAKFRRLAQVNKSTEVAGAADSSIMQSTTNGEVGSYHR